MLNHLLATILICLGVANTTPISNYNQKESNLVLTTPKKSNITQDYTIHLETTNIVGTTTNILGTGNSFYPNGIKGDTKGNMASNNAYINVIGNAFLTQYYTDINDDQGNNITATFIDNVNYVDQIATRTVISFLLKLTPYNYNVDTNSQVAIRTRIMELTDENEEDFFAYNLYFKRYIYIINDPYIDTLLNPQSYTDATQNIINEITNINNGFYYTEQQNLIQIGYNNIDNQYVYDTFTLGVTPSIDNYYFIVYRPCARFVYNTTEHTQPMICGFGMSHYAININGTNIIPDGTYEVVDIPGLMFEVIGMPFAFVSQAFNLTLFPGTPYQINIANLFLSIAAIFVFVWLLLLFIKMKG